MFIPFAAGIPRVGVIIYHVGLFQPGLSPWLPYDAPFLPCNKQQKEGAWL
jgi:hypothetical protein